MKIHLVYFSATYTTRSVCQGIAKHLGRDIVEHDITNVAPESVFTIPSEDLMIIGMPVYCGRIPEMAVERVRQFHGDRTKAIAVAVYGNREFDDALIEMRQLLDENGFQTVAAAAFIGRHCIFPAVATNRPDAADEVKMQNFAQAILPLLSLNSDEFEHIEVPGNPALRPYKRSAFCPVPTEGCTNCGTCASLCPTGAISMTDASDVNAELCIACGRCIIVCPEHERNFVGPVYAGAAEKFVAAYSVRKEPQFFFARHH